MTSRKTVVGLDFGTYSVKAVWAERRKGRVNLLRTEELQLPPDMKEPVRFIMPWLEKHGLLRSNCALALPGTQVVFQPSSLAEDDPRTPEQAVEMEMAMFNDMADETMSYCMTCFDVEKGVKQILMGIIRPEAVQQALLGAAAYPLRVHELVPSSVALFNAAVLADPPVAGPVIFVQMGHSSTDIAIGVSAGMLFARSFATGGKIFSDALHKTLGGGSAQIENIKRNEAGLEADNPHAATLLPPARLWMAQLKSVLSVYHNQYPDEKHLPRNIVLYGGGGQLRGLADFVSAELQIPCSLAGGFDFPPSFAIPYGLALAALNSARCPLSLLPERMRDEITFREKKPYWVAAGTCAALALVVFMISGIRGIGRERASAEAESRRITELKRIDDRIQTLRSDIALLREPSQPLRELLQTGPVVRELVTLVANSIHPDDWVTMICDEAVYLPPPPPEPEQTARLSARSIRNLKRSGLRTGAILAGAKKTAKTEEPPPPPPRLSAFILEGYTPHTDLETVKELIRRLLASDLIKQADVLGDERVLPAAIAGATEEESILGDLTHFVVRLEVNI